MPEIRMTLPGSIRSKKNSKVLTTIGGKNCPRRAIALPSKAYQVWEGEARKEVWKHAFMPPLPVPVSVEAICYVKGRIPDLSGCLESVGDCLEGIIYADDSQIVSWDGSRVYKDNANPRTEILVRW